MTLTYGLLVATAIAIGLSIGGSAQAAAQSAQSMVIMDDASADASQNLVLAVTINGEPSPLLAHFRERNGHLMATVKDLGELGLAVEKLGIAAAEQVALDSIPGLAYRYDAARQIVMLQVEESMRKPFNVDTRSLPKTSAAVSARGLAINYDAFAQSDAGQRFALFSELRYFDPAGVFSNTGVAYVYGGKRSYTRYDTAWSRSNQASLTTTQVGDTISSSLAWSRSIRIGGFQWRSNFALRPDLITFPVPALLGSAVVPSAIDVYVNNVRQFSSNVPSGPFIINEVPGITGAGQVTIVTNDALGRPRVSSVPLYVDARLLAPGLSSYSFEAGFVRRRYGLASFDYDPRPAFSASGRRGLSELLTLEGHAEATNGLVNAGAGAVMRLGMAGVINGSFSASAGRFAGTQMSVGYQLIEPRFSIDAQTIRAFGNYGDLASREGAPVVSAIDRVTLALPLGGRQTVSLSYIGFKPAQGLASKIGTMSYSRNIGSFVAVNLSAYKDFLQHRSHGIMLGLSIPMGRAASINAVGGRQNNQSTYQVSALRSPDYDGGWGWGAQAGGSGAAAYQRAQVQYLGNAGEVSAAAQRIAGTAGASVEVSGAMVLMDGSVNLSRHIYDAFALVSTDGVPGIPVLHENRAIGKTNGSGHLLVPDLNAYQDNAVSIDSMGLPADARIESTAKSLVPRERAGVVAHFGVARYRAASVILRGADGKLLPPGAAVRHLQSGGETIVGYDGIAFIENLEANNRLVVDHDAIHCLAEFAYTRPLDGSLPTIGPLTCANAPGGRQ
ncbi:fimbria/pilus outer membrane usher protein [Trinickia sp. LjRoot230]|uniref:fimbria/pilus outer membrane usher protein n=1 Tax=Trinickia sp. LjRoot230 TaxID=3342288 RepID=UPI003ECD96D1